MIPITNNWFDKIKFFMNKARDSRGETPNDDDDEKELIIDLLFKSSSFFVKTSKLSSMKDVVAITKPSVKIEQIFVDFLFSTILSIKKKVNVTIISRSVELLIEKIVGMVKDFSSELVKITIIDNKNNPKMMKTITILLKTNNNKTSVIKMVDANIQEELLKLSLVKRKKAKKICKNQMIFSLDLFLGHDKELAPIVEYINYLKSNQQAIHVSLSRMNIDSRLLTTLFYTPIDTANELSFNQDLLFLKTSSEIDFHFLSILICENKKTNESHFNCSSIIPCLHCFFSGRQNLDTRQQQRYYEHQDEIKATMEK